MDEHGSPRRRGRRTTWPPAAVAGSTALLVVAAVALLPSGAPAGAIDAAASVRITVSG